jgi:hypothetical protein
LYNQGQWLATICFLQSARTAFASIGYKFYLVFIFCTIALWFAVYFFFPETQNLSSEEMAKMFGDDVVVTFEKEIEASDEKNPPAYVEVSEEI